MQLLRFNSRQRAIFQAGTILTIAMGLYPPWLEIHSYPVERHVEVTLPQIPGWPERTAFTGAMEDLSYSKPAGYAWIGSRLPERTKPPVRMPITNGPITLYGSGYAWKVKYTIDWMQLGWQWAGLIGVMGIAMVCLRKRRPRAKAPPISPNDLQQREESAGGTN
jgi:hypothetical protein